MGLSDGRKSFRIGLAVLIQYRSVTASQPASHVAVAITLNAKALSLKRDKSACITGSVVISWNYNIAATAEFVVIANDFVVEC